MVKAIVQTPKEEMWSLVSSSCKLSQNRQMAADLTRQGKLRFESYLR